MFLPPPQVHPLYMCDASALEKSFNVTKCMVPEHFEKTIFLSAMYTFTVITILLCIAEIFEILCRRLGYLNNQWHRHTNTHMHTCTQHRVKVRASVSARFNSELLLWNRNLPQWSIESDLNVRAGKSEILVKCFLPLTIERLPRVLFHQWVLYGRDGQRVCPGLWLVRGNTRLSIFNLSWFHLKCQKIAQKCLKSHLVVQHMSTINCLNRSTPWCPTYIHISKVIRDGSRKFRKGGRTSFVKWFTGKYFRNIHWNTQKQFFSRWLYTLQFYISFDSQWRQTESSPKSPPLVVKRIETSC